MDRLKGKVAIITGASGGIGGAIARLFEEEGARLVLTANRNPDRLKAFKDAAAVRLDLLDRKSIQSVIKETIRLFGRIDILVNNAGIFKQTDFGTISEEELDLFLNVNLKGTFLLTQAAFAQMKKQGSGKIVMISSGAGEMGSSKAAHYAATKAALISLTKSLAKLGGRFNINVNAIAPGFIDTAMIGDLLSDRRSEIESSVPLRRIGSPQDVARCAVFLASDESNYITGETLYVDGGHRTS